MFIFIDYLKELERCVESVICYDNFTLMETETDMYYKILIIQSHRVLRLFFRLMYTILLFAISVDLSSYSKH